MKRILIRTDGSKAIGMGHLYRTLTLAGYICKHYRAEVVFVTRNNSSAVDLIKNRKFPVKRIPHDASADTEKSLIGSFIEEEKPDIIIVDVLKMCFERSYMDFLKNNSDALLVAFSDHHGKKEICADIIFNTSPLNKQTGNAKIGKYYSGFDYLILPEVYLEDKRKVKVSETVRKVAVCMGGADHNNLNYYVLSSIDKSALDFDVMLAVSSAFFKEEDTNHFISRMKHKVQVYYDSDGLFNFFTMGDIAITAGGYTHIERICCGVPGLVINQLKHQHKYTGAIKDLGATIDLGYYKDVTTKKCLKEFEKLLLSYDNRLKIANKGRQIIDGKGLRRVAKCIMD